MSAVLVEDGPDKGAIWHFGEPVKEQRALEAGTAWADLSHLDIVAIKGEDRLTWLHALTTQHHEQLQPGQWQEALILDPQGHVEYQFLVVDDGDTVFLVLDPGYKQTLIEYLNKMKFMLEVDVTDQSNNYAVLGYCLNESYNAYTPKPMLLYLYGESNDLSSHPIRFYDGTTHQDIDSFAQLGQDLLTKTKNIV